VAAWRIQEDVRERPRVWVIILRLSLCADQRGPAAERRSWRPDGLSRQEDAKLCAISGFACFHTGRPASHPPPCARWPGIPCRDPRVLIGWPFPLGSGLDGRLLLARRGRVYVQFIIIIQDGRHGGTPPDVGPWCRSNFIPHRPNFRQNETGLPDPNPKPTPAWLGSRVR